MVCDLLSQYFLECRHASLSFGEINTMGKTHQAKLPFPTKPNLNRIPEAYTRRITVAKGSGQPRKPGQSWLNLIYAW